MTLHEAIDALIDATESGNSLVLERAVAEARAAQEAYPADEAEEIVPADLADVEADGVDAPGTSDETPEA